MFVAFHLLKKYNLYAFEIINTITFSCLKKELQYESSSVHFVVCWCTNFFIEILLMKRDLDLVPDLASR